MTADFNKTNDRLPEPKPGSRSSGAEKIDPSALDGSNYTLTLALEALRTGAIGRAAYDAFIERVFDKLADQIRLYTGGESDSVMNETAVKLLGSVLYNCDLALKPAGVGTALGRIMNEPIDSIYYDGLRINREYMLKALAMLRKVKRTRIDTMCVYYNNLLSRDLERLIKSYDPKFDAKRGCAWVDYSMPTVNRSICGVGGILHLLEELQNENDFVNSFPKAQTDALWERCHREIAHPAGDMINLGELVFEQALISLIAGEPEPVVPVPVTALIRLSQRLERRRLSGEEGWYAALAVSHKLNRRAPQRYIDRLLGRMRVQLGVIFDSSDALFRFCRIYKKRQTGLSESE
ncbi:MAG: DUF6179 domain-containing protein [Candidatus Flemingiibacterium sp.]